MMRTPLAGTTKFPVVDSLTGASSGPMPSVWHEQQWCFAPSLSRELLTCKDGDQVAHRMELPNRIHGLCQLDGQRLWACGDFGTILPVAIMAKHGGLCAVASPAQRCWSSAQNPQICPGICLQPSRCKAIAASEWRSFSLLRLTRHRQRTGAPGYQSARTRRDFHDAE